MKNLVLIILVIIITFGCGEIDLDPKDTPNIEPNTIELAERNNEFGFDLLKKLHQTDPDSNIFISPMGIATALTMTLNGAAGDTKIEMQNTLHFNGWDMEEINISFKNLLDVLPVLDEDVKMKIANSIWYSPGFFIHQNFLDVNAEYFNSEVRETETSPEALKKINDWCSDNTDGLVKEVINRFPPDFVMFLINAIYFKGSWTQEFNSEYTYQASFSLGNGKYTKVDMMDYRGKVSLPYFETEQFQAVDLTYGNGVFSMSLLLPKYNVSIDELISEVNADNWDTWIDSFEKDSIYMQMPKFKMEYEKKLKDILKLMGMSKAFGEDGEVADFSKMTTSPGAHINQVFHKAFVEVNEEGTEAAAVTVVEIVDESVSLDPEFIANRPFLFFIKDSKTNSIIFSGVMMEPK